MSEQGTEEWLKARMGCATASCFKDIIAVSKSTGKPLKAREDYLWKLAVERLYDRHSESTSARSLEWGTALEPFAKQTYQIEKGVLIDNSGFVLHPTIEFCGASPDGLIDKNGGIEIKCPKDERIHMQTWRFGMSPDHLPQVQGNIWINDREWFDFISYDPRAPRGLRLYVQRIIRNDKYIKALESHVVEFLDDVKKLVEEINARQDGDLRGGDCTSSREDHENL